MQWIKYSPPPPPPPPKVGLGMTEKVKKQVYRERETDTFLNANGAGGYSLRLFALAPDVESEISGRQVGVTIRWTGPLDWTTGLTFDNVAL